jgi:uncharacterized metal-binding protein
MCYTVAMPGSHTHDTITVVSAVVLAPTAWIISPDHSIATALTVTAAHLVSGLMFSCDLDIDSREYRRWGPLRIIWWPYKETVPHRSWISHGLIIGPMLRLAYFGLIMYAVLWLLLNLTGRADLWNELVQSFADGLRMNSGQAYAFLVGFVIGGAAHSIPDWISTGTKRAWNQWTRL